ncbi:hypothetical protein [Streptomyces sp. DW26H14]|uniref:hypothetical protein n=1 Tax=Streptomyces sp. DW26H14 TaxID=3435395 RepID=UPI00403DF63F
MTLDTSPAQALIAVGRRVIPGSRFPSWAVPTRSGHLIGLISEAPTAPAPWRHRHTIRAQTLAVLLDAGLIALGDREPVPEYDGSRIGLRWEPGRTGWPLSVTEAGRGAAGASLPLELP